MDLYQSFSHDKLIEDSIAYLIFKSVILGWKPGCLVDCGNLNQNQKDGPDEGVLDAYAIVHVCSVALNDSFRVDQRLTHGSQRAHVVETQNRSLDDQNKVYHCQWPLQVPSNCPRFYVEYSTDRQKALEN